MSNRSKSSKNGNKALQGLLGLIVLVGAVLGLTAFILHFTDKKNCSEGYEDDREGADYEYQKCSVLGTQVPGGNPPPAPSCCYNLGIPPGQSTGICQFDPTDPAGICHGQGKGAKEYGRWLGCYCDHNEDCGSTNCVNNTCAPRCYTKTCSRDPYGTLDPACANCSAQDCYHDLDCASAKCPGLKCHGALNPPQGYKAGTCLLC